MSVKFHKDFNKNVPSWESCIKNFNQSVLTNDLIKHNCLGFFVSHKAHLIQEVKSVLENLNLRVAHLYMNITIHGKTFGNHKDADDVYFWQVQGETKWTIESGYEFLLQSGDLIFVPKGVYHNVIPLSPRVGISMSL